MLHTETLQKKYGPMHAVVLRHDEASLKDKDKERIREALLVDGTGITRTYALVFLDNNHAQKELSEIDKEIRAGGMIGETFRTRGYEAKRNVIDHLALPLPPWMQNHFDTQSEQAVAKILEFYVRKEESIPARYGIILEIYSPDFMDPHEAIPANDLKPVGAMMHKAGVPIEKLWHYIGEDAEELPNDGVRNIAEQAKEMTQTIIKSLRDRIALYFKTQMGQTFERPAA